MKNRFIILLFIFFITVRPDPVNAQDQEIQVVKFDALESILNSDSEKIQVINFWATWCAPCIKELPYFVKAGDEYENQIDLHLISLDYADQADKVSAFASRKSLDGNVVILDEVDYNSWIDKVDPSWSGAIPATLFINPKTGERIFMERQMTYEDLVNELNALLN